MPLPEHLVDAAALPDLVLDLPALAVPVACDGVGYIDGSAVAVSLQDGAIVKVDFLEKVFPVEQFCVGMLFRGQRFLRRAVRFLFPPGSLPAWMRLSGQRGTCR